MYAIVQTHKSHNWSVKLNCDLSADPVHGEHPPSLAGGKIRCRRHLYRAEIQRSDEDKRNKKLFKWSRSPYVNLLTHASSYHPYL